VAVPPHRVWSQWEEAYGVTRPWVRPTVTRDLEVLWLWLLLLNNMMCLLGCADQRFRRTHFGSLAVVAFKARGTDICWLAASGCIILVAADSLSRAFLPQK